MHVHEAQREVREVFLRGGPGQVVSGTIWLVSAALATLGTHRQGMLFLVIAGMFIFPITQATLRAIGRKASLSKGNPFGQLAMQVAFTVPLSLPLVGAAALYRESWFYPAMMIVVGAHYLPFIFLYGMWEYGVLAAALLGAALYIGLQVPDAMTLGGWLGGAFLMFSGLVSWVISRQTPSEP